MHEAYLIKVNAPSSSPDTARARLSSVKEDRMGDILEPGGCQYQAYLQDNPILLYDHGLDPQIARKPVGRMVRIQASPTDLVGEWRWSASAEGKDIKARWDGGDLNAVSVGFRPIDVVPLPTGGLHYKVWEMLENSVVSIPACQSCLAIRCACGEGRTMRYDEEETYDIDEALLRQLVRAQVQAAMMAVTGRLDAGDRPRRSRPTQRQASEVVLELAPEPPPRTRAELMERLGYDYVSIGRLYQRAGVDNSRFARQDQR